MSNEPPQLLCLAGPTASGKTGVAIELARSLGGEIISADARQVYQYLDIGTAKPTARERARARHHLVDYVDPTEDYSAGRFVRDAEKAITEIRSRGKLPIIAGGTGLYFRALLRGLDVWVGRDDFFRAEIKERIAQEGSAALHAELTQIDPESAARIHPNDPTRIIRALEVFQLTGKKQSEHHRENAPPRHHYRMALLTLPRQELYDRINLRFDLMIQGGLVEEVRTLLARGYGATLSCFRSPGYRELVAFLQDRISLDEAIETGKREHRRYAKRQITWFKKENAVPFELSERGAAGGSAGSPAGGSTRSSAGRRIAEWWEAG